MGLSTWEVKQRIMRSDDPAATAAMYGRRGGRAAHNIQDVLNNKGPGLYCRTAVHGWHLATPRERQILNKSRGRSQRCPTEEQLMLAI